MLEKQAGFFFFPDFVQCGKETVLFIKGSVWTALSLLIPYELHQAFKIIHDVRKQVSEDNLQYWTLQ